MSFGNLDPNATGNFTLQQVKAKKKVFTQHLTSVVNGNNAGNGRLMF